MVATNWAHNLDVLSSFDVPALSQAPPPPPVEPPPATHTVTLLMTDGDNVQWLLNDMSTSPSWWASPARGSLNLGWTLSLGLSELAPAAMGHLYDTASPPTGPGGRDYFVGGLSGIGYM